VTGIGPLFDHARKRHAAARRTDPQTSKDAAARIEKRTVVLEALVLQFLAEHPDGATTHEISEQTGTSLVSISPRMAPLQRDEKIVRTKQRRNGSAVYVLASQETQ
jgi:hypothetical protein